MKYACKEASYVSLQLRNMSLCVGTREPRRSETDEEVPGGVGKLQDCSEQEKGEN